jgi:hypothetical protein
MQGYSCQISQIARLEGDADLLHSQTASRAFGEGDKVPVHGRVVLSQPSLRAEFEWLGPDGWVGVHVVDGHADGGLAMRRQA